MRYKCKYTQYQHVTVNCVKCGAEYSYKVPLHAPNTHRETCDACASRGSLEHRRSYDRAIEAADYLTDTSALLIIDLYLGIHRKQRMTLPEISALICKDERDIALFVRYIRSKGLWDMYVRQLRFGPDRVGALDFLATGMA